MLRVVSAICAEPQALEAVSFARRDVSKYLRARLRRYSTAAHRPPAQIVLAGDSGEREERASGGVRAPVSPPPPPPPPPPPRRAWTVAAAALAVTASLGGVYFYRKLADGDGDGSGSGEAPAPALQSASEAAVVEPGDGAALPAHAQFLLVGGGTASFAAMRAIRSARPDAQVLIVGEEPHPPYMRPPLSKEVWREPTPSGDPTDLHALSFRQWNGKRRPLAYEPLAFYTPADRLASSGGGASVARGWRVARLHVERREAELVAPGRAPVTLTYDECLVATGSRARRLPALAGARAAGRAFALRDARDAVRLARALDAPDADSVLLVGGGYLATELSAALAERLAGTGKRVVQVFREEAPLARVLPPYLAAEAARRLREAGVLLRPHTEVVGSAEDADGAVLALADGQSERAACVVECAGAEPALEVARASGLEEHADLGGVLVSAELQARAGVWAAGDVACFYDVALGRRRVEHHDHAVVSGRLAGENMAGVAPQRPYTHQSMFWSDIGPELGYEAIGIIDSRLPTVGVFSATAVTEVGATAVTEVGATAVAGADAGAPAGERRYSRGVVFYTRERRVVGVLLWNLFNRMHIARQVLAHGEFDDLLEAGKLFKLHEDD